MPRRATARLSAGPMPSQSRSGPRTRNIKHSTTVEPATVRRSRRWAPVPAVSVNDLTALTRLPEPGLGDQPRPVWQVSTAPLGYEGEGFPVRRAFAGIDL